MTKSAFRGPVLLSVAFWIVFAGFIRVAVVPPESCGDERITSVQAATAGAEEWLWRNQKPDGSYLYLYDAGSDRVIGGYNDVRHAGVTMALYQAAGRLDDPQALNSADRGLEWMRKRLLRQDGWAALESDDGQARLGGSALMLVGLTERRAATGDTRDDELMRELGRFLVRLQKPDGGFYVSWLEAEGAPRYEGTSKYYPGEAFWALSLLRKAFPNEGWEGPVKRAAEYLTTQRDEVEDIDFPPTADQWTAYGLAEMADLGLSDEQVEYARDLAGRFGFLVRIETQRQGGWYGALVRGGAVRASGTGTWVEGLAALWRLASVEPRLADVRPKIEERLRCSSGILTERQVGESDAASYPDPDRTRGAWLIDDETRMDDQQHAFSGLLYTLDAMQGRTERAPDAQPATASR